MGYLIEHFPQLRAELNHARQSLKRAETQSEKSGGFRKHEWLKAVKERQARVRSLERVKREIERNRDRWIS